MTGSDLQARVVDALSAKPRRLRDDTIAYLPSETAPVVKYVRFFQERAAFTAVRRPHEEQTALDFLFELREEELDLATEAAPVVLRPSGVSQAAGFDHRSIVHPVAAQIILSRETQFAMPQVYLTFPAYECEFTQSDTWDEARFRLSKVVSYSRWDRAPAPVISARFAMRSGQKSTGGKRLGYFEPDAMRRTLDRVLQQGGFLEIENFKREVVTIRVEDHAAEVVSEAGSRPLARDAVVGWYTKFLLKGFEVAGASYVD